MWGQWTTGSSGAIYYNGGSVGIGTTTPVYNLEVVNPSGQGVHTILGYGGGTAGGGVLALRSSEGSPATPGASLSGDLLGHLAYQGYAGGFTPGVRIRGWAAQNWSGSGTGAYLTFETTTNGTTTPVERVRIDNAGNVGIGTADPCTNSQAPSNCRLSVAGAIQAQEVVVNSGWSDYVFDPGYRLTPLDQVAGYIEEHHHLPDIPSEAEVKDKGIKVGEIEAKLLAKIEELTLHMIQSEEQNHELEERIVKLESQLSQKREH